MKTKLFFCVIFFLMVSPSFSQFNKGNWLLSGALKYSHNSFKQNQTDFLSGGIYEMNKTSTNIFLSPYAGYFIADNWVIGLSLSGFLNYSSISYDWFQPGGNFNTSGFSVLPFVRSYIPLHENFVFFSELATGVTYSKTNGTSPSLDVYQKMNSFDVTVSSGLAYFLNKKLALELKIASLDFQSINSYYSEAYKSHQNSFGVNFFFNHPTFGFSAYL